MSESDAEMMAIAPAMSATCVVCGAQQTARFQRGAFTYHRCASCGLLSTYPLPDTAAMEAHYANKFRDGNYAALRAFADQYTRSVYSGFVKALGRKIALPNARILDIGCFTGDFLGLLAARGADVVGLELQSQAVEIAQKKLPGRVFQADVMGASFPTDPCDAVTMMGVLEHVTDPMRLVARAAELLKPGGVLMLQTPDSSSFLAKLLGRFWPPCAPVEHIHLFSRRALADALTQVDLVAIEFRPHWKRLPIAYVYEMLRFFGPELRKVAGVFLWPFPRTVLASASLPFYVGEMIVTARKRG